MILVADYKDTHFKLVAEKTQHNGQTGVRQATGRCAYWRCAASVEFVASKLVRKEGSDCCGEWGVVCLTKRQWLNGAQGEGADVMMKGVCGPHTCLGFSC